MVSRTLVSSPSWPRRTVTSDTWRRRASAIVPMPRSATALAPEPSSIGATYATTSSTSPAARKARARVGPPSRKTCCRSRANRLASASRGSCVRRCTVSARSLKTRRSAGRSRRPMTARSGCTATGSSTSSRTVSSGSSTSTVAVPMSIVSQRPRRRWVSRRAARLDTQRLVPSVAALRPSRVVANFQVTKGRWCSTAKLHDTVDRARLVGDHQALRRPRRRPHAGGRRRPWRPGWRLTARRRHGVRRQRRAPRVHGPVRPVWLHGSRVTTAVAPRAASPASREGRGLGVRATPPRGGSPPRSSSRPGRGARSRRAGWGPAVRRE